MAKTLILAVVAAVLCGLGAVSSSPVPLHKPNLQFDWINTTAILEQLAESLQPVQDDIDETDRIVMGVVGFVEATTNSIDQSWSAASWNQTVADLVDQAQELGIDVEDCILAEEEPINDVLRGLKDDVDKCLAPNLQSVKQVVVALRADGDKARDLLAEAKDMVSQCNDYGFFAFACLAGQVPAIQDQISELVREADELAKTALSEGAALYQALFVGPCTQDASNSRAQQASDIINAAEQCIRDKLPTPEPVTEPEPEPTPEPQPEPQPQPQ